MKFNKHFIFFAVIPALFFYSCDKGTPDSPEETKAFIEIEKTDVSFSSTGGETSLVIKTNAEEVKAVSDKDWISCDVSAAKDRITIKVEPNTGSDRNGTITVNCSLGKSSATGSVSVTQAKADVVAYYVDKSEPDFSDSRILDVYGGSRIIAQICREYIYTEDQTVDRIMDVIYLLNDEGSIDLGSGMDINDGTKLIWKRTDTTDECSIEASEAPAGFKGIYITGNGFSFDKPESGIVASATLTDSYLADERADDKNYYSYVKIGTQYWLAENFKAERYNDLSAIDCKGWSEDGSFKIYLWDPSSKEAPEFKDYMGLAYNGYAVFSPKGLVPEGWDVPSAAQWDRLYNYLRNKRGTKVKDQYWISDGEDAVYANITGLSIDCAYNWMPHGTVSGWNDETEKTYFWTSELVTDGAKKSYRYVYLMKSSSSIGRSYSPTLDLSHEMDYGDYLRIVKPIATK